MGRKAKDGGKKLDYRCDKRAFRRNVKYMQDVLGYPEKRALAAAFVALRKACGVPPDAPPMDIAEYLGYTGEKVRKKAAARTAKQKDRYARRKSAMEEDLAALSMHPMLREGVGQSFVLRGGKKVKKVKDPKAEARRRERKAEMERRQEDAIKRIRDQKRRHGRTSQRRKRPPR